MRKLRQAMRDQRTDAYIIGAANAGKSSFINLCLGALPSTSRNKMKASAKEKDGVANVVTVRAPPATCGAKGGRHDHWSKWSVANALRAGAERRKTGRDGGLPLK